MTVSNSQPYHHGDLRRVLIEAALGILQEEQGLQFTLREIARRAGVSHAAPYRHFPDKAALLEELAEVGFEKMGEQFTAVIQENLPIEEHLIAIGKAYIEFGISNPALYQLMFSADAGKKEEERAMATLNILITLLKRGQEKGVFKIRPIHGQAAACCATVHGLTMLAINGLLVPEKFGENPIESALATLLEGIARFDTPPST
ncbi:MAG: TetR/AcrR family transcriptional regulator [Methylococcales bacterium]|nr:TetR/AcrR family transcriptional regulator [Methylococcales bacterium]